MSKDPEETRREVNLALARAQEITEWVRDLRDSALTQEDWIALDARLKRCEELLALMGVDVEDQL